MLLFIPRSLCALKRVAAKSEHARFGATQGIRIANIRGLYRAEATDGHRAIIVQGLTPTEEPPWPGFKELPDDACEAIILPKDLERACKVGEAVLQSRFDSVGLATQGNAVSLGLGTDVVSAPKVEGRFPKMDQVIPKQRPLFTFRVDPKTLAETLLAMADLLPDGARGVQCFYYGGWPADRLLRQELGDGHDDRRPGGAARCIATQSQGQGGAGKGTRRPAAKDGGTEAQWPTAQEGRPRAGARGKRPSPAGRGGARRGCQARRHPGRWADCQESQGQGVVVGATGIETWSISGMHRAQSTRRDRSNPRGAETKVRKISCTTDGIS
jgi:hypothetical protein